jgi:hypothetical protein
MTLYTFAKIAKVFAVVASEQRRPVAEYIQWLTRMIDLIIKAEPEGSA